MKHNISAAAPLLLAISNHGLRIQLDGRPASAFACSFVGHLAYIIIMHVLDVSYRHFVPKCFNHVLLGCVTEYLFYVMVCFCAHLEVGYAFVLCGSLGLLFGHFSLFFQIRFVPHQNYYCLFLFILVAQLYPLSYILKAASILIIASVLVKSNTMIVTIASFK